MINYNESIETNQLLNVSHELRNALNIMMATCTMAEHNVDDRDKVLDYLSRIHVTGERITGLIDNLLDAKPELVGEGIRDEMAFSIDELEAELIALLKPLAIEKCIAFDVRTEGVINRDVVGDCGRMLKILVNVISNSIKYTPGKGTVVLFINEENAGSETGEYVFSCCDNGIGMSDDFIGHIFEPFSRADDERVKAAKGTGLGMYIVKRTVEELGGSIHVESTIDMGTRITIRLKLKRCVENE